MPGFAELLSYLGAIDKAGASVVKAMDRVAEAVDAPRDAEPVTDALALRRANAATPVGAEVPAMVRILGQMRAVQAGAQEAERTIESLNVRAEEVSTEVELKISKALAAILDPGKGEGVSGNFDKDTGQFLGGAFSFEAARDLVDRFIELQDIQKTKLDAFQTYYVNESMKATANQFRVEFGSKLGDIKGLAKALRDYLSATAKKDAATGPTSGTLGRPKAQSSSPMSYAVARWTGTIR